MRRQHFVVGNRSTVECTLCVSNEDRYAVDARQSERRSAIGTGEILDTVEAFG